MKAALCLAGVLVLAAPSAFGQSGVAIDENTNPFGNDFPEAPTYYKPAGGDSPEAVELTRLIRDALETSRQLDQIDVYDREAMEIEAPLTVVKSTDGKKVTITFDVTPARGTDRSFKADCPTTQLDRCADAVIRRAERVARETIDRPNS